MKTTNSPQRQKFCILTTQRSGSTWLVKLLASHPQVRCFDEMLLYEPPIERRDPLMLRYFDYRQRHGGLRPWVLLDYMNTYFDQYPGDYPIIGYKIMYDQLVKRFEALYPLVRQQYKLIHLVRQNGLDIVISKQRMRQTGVAHAKALVKAAPVYLNPRTLVMDLTVLETKVWVMRLLLHWLPNSCLEITYEALYRDPTQVMSQVLAFIGADPSVQTLHSDIVKSAQGTYADKILNYADVVQCLSGTRFAPLIQETEGLLQNR